MKTILKPILTLSLITLLLALFYGTGHTQTSWTGGLYFNPGFPMDELKDNIDRNAYGFGASFFYSPQKSPLAVGLDFSWMNYGRESRHEPFSTTIPDVTVNVVTANNIAQFLFVLRGRMPQGPIQLYGDALIGGNYLYTETAIKGIDEVEDVVSHTNLDDMAFAYGVGGGVQVPLWGQKKSEKRRALQLLLDGGVRYIAGGEAEYLKEGSIARSGTTVTYDTIKSRTDMVRAHIGLVIRF